MNSPFVFSIVTPSFEQGEYIARTMESVLTQQGNFLLEYRVVDGGSTDSTLKVLAEFEQAWNNGTPLPAPYSEYRSQFKNRSWNNCLGIKFSWVSEKDQGQPDAINKGWKQATGSLLAFLNSDDMYLPGAFGKILDVSMRKPSVGIFYGGGVHVNENDILVALYPSEAPSLSRLFSHCIICQPTTFIRPQVIEKYQAMNISLQLSFDYEFWLRLMKNKVPFHFMSELLAVTRLHAKTKTLQRQNDVIQEIAEMQKTLLNKVSTHWIQQLAASQARVTQMGEGQKHSMSRELEAFRKYNLIKGISFLPATWEHWLYSWLGRSI